MIEELPQKCEICNKESSDSLTKCKECELYFCNECAGEVDNFTFEPYCFICDDPNRFSDQDHEIRF